MRHPFRNARLALPSARDGRGLEIVRASRVTFGWVLETADRVFLHPDLVEWVPAGGRPAAAREDGVLVRPCADGDEQLAISVWSPTDLPASARPLGELLADWDRLPPPFRFQAALAELAAAAEGGRLTACPDSVWATPAGLHPLNLGLFCDLPGTHRDPFPALRDLLARYLDAWAGRHVPGARWEDLAPAGVWDGLTRSRDLAAALAEGRFGWPIPALVWRAGLLDFGRVAAAEVERAQDAPIADPARGPATPSDPEPTLTEAEQMLRVPALRVPAEGKADPATLVRLARAWAGELPGRLAKWRRLAWRLLRVARAEQAARRAAEGEREAAAARATQSQAASATATQTVRTLTDQAREASRRAKAAEGELARVRATAERAERWAEERAEWVGRARAELGRAVAVPLAVRGLALAVDAAVVGGGAVGVLAATGGPPTASGGVVAFWGLAVLALRCLASPARLALGVGLVRVDRQGVRAADFPTRFASAVLHYGPLLGAVAWGFGGGVLPPRSSEWEGFGGWGAVATAGWVAFHLFWLFARLLLPDPRPFCRNTTSVERILGLGMSRIPVPDRSVLVSLLTNTDERS